jgi:hypothetical protein
MMLNEEIRLSRAIPRRANPLCADRIGGFALFLSAVIFHLAILFDLLPK